MKPQKIEALEIIARETIGDGKSPELFFVSDQGTIVTITRDFATAYKHFCKLAHRSPRVECALEARSFGVVCSVEPLEEGRPLLTLIDDARTYFRFKHLSLDTLYV